MAVLFPTVTNFPTYDTTGYTTVSQFDYAHDALGRRVSHTVPVTGDAPLDVDVYVNGTPADRQGPHWHAPVTAGNTQTAAYPEIETLGVLIPQDPDAPDEYAAATSRVFIAKTPELFTDADGNMTSDGRFIYTWNGENRLILAETRADLPPEIPRHRVTYAYDHQGRMVFKEVFDISNNCKLTTKNFLWDSYNIIAETTVSPSPIPDSSFPITNCTQYVWGLDLSGSLQSAGGVGGLLAVIRDDGTFAPAYDANGNITEYIALKTDNSQLETGSIAAHYEYDAFGNTVVQSGTMTDIFAFRFSTKYFEVETGIVHFELSPYSPPLGRWINRDSIWENGGINLYGFCGNDAVTQIDLLGLKSCCDEKEMNELLVARTREAARTTQNDGLEDCGSICCDEKNKTVSFTGSLEDTEANRKRYSSYGMRAKTYCVAKPCPSGTTTFAVYHSHPRDVPGAETFSDEDKKFDCITLAVPGSFVCYKWIKKTRQICKWQLVTTKNGKQEHQWVCVSQK